jgi:carbonic anhydrase
MAQNIPLQGKCFTQQRVKSSRFVPITSIMMSFNPRFFALALLAGLCASASLAAASDKDAASEIKSQLGKTKDLANKQLILTVKGKAVVDSSGVQPYSAAEQATRSKEGAAAYEAQYQRARAIALTGRDPKVGKKIPDAQSVLWDYEGPRGPQNWGQLHPDWKTCANGKRQSPVAIEDGTTLQGPVEPLRFAFQPSAGRVVNNGRTIQVNVSGDNSLTLRGSTYQLMQLSFHHPAEIQINGKKSAMSVHMVHQNELNQKAVVAVLLDTQDTPDNKAKANPLVHKVWTYMPVDAGDQVPLPEQYLSLAELLPANQQYFQFMGSLSTPPCSEGVLWIVMKDSVAISAAQLRLFAQLFPMNARPLQALNGRPVREGQ